MTGLINRPLIRSGDVDDEVAAFVKQQFWDVGPFPGKEPIRSAQQVVEHAVWRYGYKRCRHLKIQWH